MTKDIRELDNFCKNLQLFMQETIFDEHKSFHALSINPFLKISLESLKSIKISLGRSLTWPVMKQ